MKCFGHAGWKDYLASVSDEERAALCAKYNFKK